MRTIVISVLFMVMGLPLWSQPMDDKPPIYYKLEDALKVADQARYLEIEPDRYALGLLRPNIANLSRVENVKIKGSGDGAYLSSILVEIQRLSSLHTIILEDNGIDRFPVELYDIRGLQTLVIHGNPAADFGTLMQGLSRADNLRAIHLDNNALVSLPRSIKDIPSLQEVYITNNSGIDAKETIKTLVKVKNLRELGLPLDGIASLPESISKLDSLRVLDIRNNVLTGLPRSIGKIDSLSSLKMEGNIMIDPAAEAGKLEGLNIKFLSMDESLNSTEQDKLSRMFPSADIKVRVDGFFEDEEEEKEKGTTVAVDNGGSPAVPQMNVAVAPFRVYSTAYLHYPAIFSSLDLRTAFDTTTFHERYTDTSYIGTLKRPDVDLLTERPPEVYRDNLWRRFWDLPGRWLFKSNDRGMRLEGPQSYLYIHRRGLLKKKINFTFEASTTQDMIFNFPELRSFGGMRWICEDMTKKEFKKRYVKDKLWTDVRVHYHEAEKMFTLELKHMSGFETMKGYLLMQNLKQKKDMVSRQYDQRYRSYTKGLERRERKFIRNQVKRRTRMDKLFASQEVRAWNALKEYMSDEEKKLSAGEWLEYYDQVISNESMALYSAAANGDNFRRSLLLDGYSRDRDEARVDMVAGGDSIRPIAFRNLFVDMVNGKGILPVARIFAINTGTRTFSEFRGNLGLDPTSLFLINGVSYHFVAELRNGDLAVTDLIQISSLPDDQTSHLIKARKMESKLFTVGQVRTEVGLK